MAEIAIMGRFLAIALLFDSNSRIWCVVLVAEIADDRLWMHQWKAMGSE